MARYGQAFKNKVPPLNPTALENISLEVGVLVDTPECFRAQSLTKPPRKRAWSSSARLDIVISMAALYESRNSAWCCENCLCPQELYAWLPSATQTLTTPEKQRASQKEAAADHKRSKELDRETHRRDKTLAETAPLLVLSKKCKAILHKGEDDDRTGRPPQHGQND